MNLQEAFDKVVTHARTQKCKSERLSNGLCLYRGPNNTKCFVGALIPDNQYDEDLEEQSLGEVIDHVPALSGLNESNLKRLQTIHDLAPIEQWEEQFSKFAAAHGLTYEALPA